MSTSPPPPSLRRPLLIGGSLALAAVVLFILLWVIMGNAGVEALPRLLVSLCVPPAIIAVVVGAYILIARPGNSA